jgi:hypothetical protein
MTTAPGVLMTAAPKTPILSFVARVPALVLLPARAVAASVPLRRLVRRWSAGS